MAIVTLSDYKTWAGITGTGDDTRLQVVIDSAHAALRRYCGRSLTNGFESATRTEDYLSDTGELQLREWPVTSITSITPIDASNNLGTAIDSTAYRVDLRTGIVTLNDAESGRYFYDDDEYLVSGGWGTIPNFGRVRIVYVSEAAAADLEMALYKTIDGVYAGIRRDATIASESLGNWSTSYRSADEGIAAQNALLSPYRSGSGGVG